MMLLTLIVFLIGIIRSFFTQDRTRRYLAGKRETAGNVMAAQAVELTEAKTIGETTLSLSYDKKTKVLTVGGAKVVSADVVAGNGVIHVVDSVILPSKN